MEEWTVTYDKYMLEKLDYIANYIANELDNAFGAQKVLDSIKRETQKLATMPLRFPLYPFNNTRIFRFIVIGSYVVTFKANEKTKTVNILDIFHQHQLQTPLT